MTLIGNDLKRKMYLSVFILNAVFIHCGQLFDHPSGSRNLENSRKLVYVNNKPYDLSSSEQSRIRGLHMKKASFALSDDAYDGALPQDDAFRTRGLNSGGRKSAASYLSDLDSDSQSVKSSQRNQLDMRPSYRFVADPDMQHLIEVVDVDVNELQKPAEIPVKKTENQDASPGKVDSVSSNSEIETATIKYIYTEKPLWDRVWGELSSIGLKFRRDVIGSLGENLYAMWKGLVEIVKKAGTYMLESQAKTRLLE